MQSWLSAVWTVKWPVSAIETLLLSLLLLFLFSLKGNIHDQCNPSFPLETKSSVPWLFYSWWSGTLAWLYCGSQRPSAPSRPQVMPYRFQKREAKLQLKGSCHFLQVSTLLFPWGHNYTAKRIAFLCIYLLFFKISFNYSLYSILFCSL